MNIRRFVAAFSAIWIISPSLSFAQTTTAPARFEISASSSTTGEGDTDYAGQTNGSVELRTLRASTSYRGSFSEVLTYHAGAGFAQVDIDITGNVPLPERLQSLFGDFGVAWNIARAWTLVAAVQPGLYSDTEASDSDGFAVPGLLLAQWRGGGAWSFGAGARFSSLSRNPVTPIAYARWQPNARWTISFGAPRTEAAYKISATTTLFAGGSFEGGSFAVDTPNATPPGYPHLRETKLDYREIRTGAGIRWQASRALRIQLEGGAAVDRRFDYFDRDLKIEADSASFIALSVVGTF
jgi:hypothetical protein